MSQAKRKRDDEPSTSSSSDSNTRKKKFVPISYEEFNESDEEIDAIYMDSGSEYEPSPSDIESYIADGSRSFIANVNTFENLAIDPSIQNASITEISDVRGSNIQNNGDSGQTILSIETAVNSELTLGEITNTPLNDTTASAGADVNNTIKHGK